jgi:ribosomal protein S14
MAQRMRAKSPVRRKRDAKAKPVRDALRALGHCEICGVSRTRLDVHEICRGQFRQAALDKPFALLLLCRKCHDEVGSAAVWPEARQLAVLAKSRPNDFSLADYLALTSPNAPRRIEISEILEYMEEEYLTKRDIAERLQVDRRAVQNWITSGKLPAIDTRTVGASTPLYRVAWSDYLEFCKARKVVK